MSQKRVTEPSLGSRVGAAVTGGFAVTFAAVFVTFALTGKLPASWQGSNAEGLSLRALRVLLVDDDGDVPDVRRAYTTPLDNLGMSYEVWDTSARGTGPSLKQLSTFDAVIWFTGGLDDLETGPSRDDEAALSAWLRTGRFLLISSQDYNWARRGPTDLMLRFMGVASVRDDGCSSRTVFGAGTVFDGLDRLRLEYEFEEYADSVEPANGSITAFRDEVGSSVGVLNESRGFKTLYLGFPLEAVLSERDRREVLRSFFEVVRSLIFNDGFESGDTSAWSMTFPPQPTPTPTSTATSTRTGTSTSTATRPATQTAPSTATATRTATQTAPLTATATRTATQTATSTATATRTSTPTATRTSTPVR